MQALSPVFELGFLLLGYRCLAPQSNEYRGGAAFKGQLEARGGGLVLVPTAAWRPGALVFRRLWQPFEQGSKQYFRHDWL